MSGLVVWFTGLPGSGKSTLARAVFQALRSKEAPCVVLDGDEIRAAMVPAHGHDEAGRDAFYETLSRLAALLAHQGLAVLVPATAHRAVYRERAMELAPAYLEVHVTTDAAECRARDPKGLWAASASGRLQHLPGADVVFEAPGNHALQAQGGLDADAVHSIVEAVCTRLGANRSA